MPAGISKRKRCTTSSPPASGCSDPTCAWGQKQRFVRLPFILQRIKGSKSLYQFPCAAQGGERLRGIFSFLGKRISPFDPQEKGIRLAVSGLNDLGTSGMRMPARGVAALGVAIRFDFLLLSAAALPVSWQCSLISVYRGTHQCGERSNAAFGTQSAAVLSSHAPHDSKARLQTKTNRRGSWRSHVHRT